MKNGTMQRKAYEMSIHGLGGTKDSNTSGGSRASK